MQTVIDIFTDPGKSFQRLTNNADTVDWSTCAVPGSKGKKRRLGEETRWVFCGVAESRSRTALNEVTYAAEKRGNTGFGVCWFPVDHLNGIWDECSRPRT
jgi:hypothetical protein